MPIRKSEPAPAAAAEATPSTDFQNFGMQQMEPSFIGKFWANASTPVKGAAVAAVAVAVIAAGMLIFKPGVSSDSAGSGPASTSAAESTVPAMVIGGGGWTTNWGSDVPSNKGKQISLFRPSMVMTDYRLEFRGQIEKKAIGWIFRASNPKNYYVAKLEVVKGGLNPGIALIKYPVIKGQEGTHTQVLLPNDFSLDTVYRVRMDVRGNKFTTYVQDKLVDYWTDDQIKIGGAGFYTEPGERAQIKSSQISYLSSTGN